MRIVGEKGLRIYDWEFEILESGKDPSVLRTSPRGGEP